MERNGLKIIGRVGKCLTATCPNYGKFGKYKGGFCKMCGNKVEKYILVEPKAKVREWTVRLIVESE